MQLEIEKQSDQGVRDLVADVKKWKPKTKRARRIKDLLGLIVLGAVVVAVIYVVLWVLTHLIPW